MMCPACLSALAVWAAGAGGAGGLAAVALRLRHSKRREPAAPLPVPDPENSP